MTAQHLEPRTKPTQLRAEKTVDLILRTAAELLENAGFEELTTNKICKAAGLTPPALYRYFPNKYAIVSELGRLLMERQNEALFEKSQAIETQGPDVDVTYDVLVDQVRVTRAFKGGVAILRTLYATPQLSDIRLTSHTVATQGISAELMSFVPHLSTQELHRRVRLMVEVGNSVIEMVVENPSDQENELLRDTAEMMNFLIVK